MRIRKLNMNGKAIVKPDLTILTLRNHNSYKVCASFHRETEDLKRMAMEYQSYSSQIQILQ